MELPGKKSNSPQYLFLAGKNRSVEVDAGVDKQAGRHLAFVFPAGHEEVVEVLPEPDHLSRVGRLEAGGSLWRRGSLWPEGRVWLWVVGSPWSWGCLSWEAAGNPLRQVGWLVVGSLWMMGWLYEVVLLVEDNPWRRVWWLVEGNPLKRGLLFLEVVGNPWRRVGLFLGVEQRAVGSLSRMVV